MLYKKIYDYLHLYLVFYPTCFFIIVRNICDEQEGTCMNDNNFTLIFKFFLITYILGILIILGITGMYTISLLWNKILYKLQQYIRRFRKIFKIQKKKIGKYPIIIQYTPPKGLTPMEVGYLYNLKQFKGSISCLFYKWTFEKRISMDFKKGKFLSLDKVNIKIINNSFKNMPESEQFQRNLIFGEDKEIVLPNIDILKKIPIINLETAKNCLDKDLIKKSFSVILKSKIIERIFAISCILWFPSILLIIHIQKQMQGELPDGILIGGVGFITMILFLLVILKIVFKDTKLTYYKLSEKGKETLAKIYGYKYFLEACDEKKIKTFLEQDSEYLEKNMPYAISLGVETEIIESIAPNLLDGINNNRYIGDIYSTAKTMITSSECTMLFPAEKEGMQKEDKSIKNKKINKIKKEDDLYQKKAEVKF